MISSSAFLLMAQAVDCVLFPDVLEACDNCKVVLLSSLLI